MKKLTKSSNRMICGVCAGIGEYLGIDATVVRLLWVIFSMLGGSGILAYIIAAIIIPEVEIHNNIKKGESQLDIP